MINDHKIPRYLKIFVKFWYSGKKIKSYHSTKIKRFYSITKAENFQKAYLKISYGTQFDIFGKLKEFYNDGEYSNKKDLINAYRAFIEK